MCVWYAKNDNNAERFFCVGRLTQDVPKVYSSSRQRLRRRSACGSLARSEQGRLKTLTSRRSAGGWMPQERGDRGVPDTAGGSAR